MKVAVVCDVLAYGGASKVVTTLAKALNADVITANNHRPRQKNTFKVIELNELTKPLKGINPFLTSLGNIYDTLRFLSLTLPDYDVLWLSGTNAVYASINNPSNIWYCHGPNRACLLYTSPSPRDRG